MGEKIPGNDVASVWEFFPTMPVQLEMLLRNEEKKTQTRTRFYWLLEQTSNGALISIPQECPTTGIPLSFAYQENNPLLRICTIYISAFAIKYLSYYFKNAIIIFDPFATVKCSN